MNFNYKGKTINIPDDDIDKLVTHLHISQLDAIDIWLDDHNYTQNEIADALTKKAKANGTEKIKAGNDKTKRKKTEHKQVENPLKQSIINEIYTFLLMTYPNIDINIVNNTKIIEFTLQNRQFKIDLIEKRMKKA